jgi:hypothetical protein
VAVVVALSLTLLLGCAALVVDVGAALAARAAAQSAADAAALAGAARLPADPAAALAAAGAMLADALPAAAQAVGWATDGDDGNGEVRCWRPPAPPGGGPGCAAGATAIRVVTPPLRQPSVFAGVFGRAATAVRAAATAGVFSAGQLLPWGLLAGEPLPPGGRACLAARGGVGDRACGGGEGSLGALDSPRAPCQRGRAAYLANLAQGLDHRVAVDSGDRVQDVCDPSGVPTVLTVADRGQGATGAGLVGDPGGRLRRRPALGGRVAGGGWDGDFLDPADAGPGGLPVVGGYSGGGFLAPGRTFASYLACLAAPAAPGCRPVFAARIAASPRFGYLPVLAPLDGSTGWPGRGGRMRVVGFQAAFIETLLDGSGLPTLGPTVAGVGVLLLPASLLPDDLVGPGAGAVPFAGGPRTVHLTG